MVAGLRSYLAAMDINVVSEIAKASLVLSSEPAFPDGGFDAGAMLLKLEDALDQALNDGYKGLWATGDITWEFGPEKDFGKLLEYEQGLDELFQKRPELCGICQYHRDTLPAEAMQHGLLSHPGIFINDTLSRINPQYLPAGFSPEHRATNQELDDAVNRLCGLKDRR